MRIAIATLLATTLACGGESRPTETPHNSDGFTGPIPIPQDTATLKLVGLGVTIAPFDSSTGRAGDFDLTLPMYNGPLGFVGRPVYDPQGNIKHLYEYDFFVAPGTLVRAPVDGVIAWVQRQNESSDYELLIRPKMNSIWAVSFDHVSQVYVDSGTTVKAGDVIAQVRTFSSGGPSPRNIGFVELMIVNEKTDTAFCPLALAHPAKADSLSQAVRSIIHAWRATGAATPDTTGTVMPGCLLLSGPSM